MKTLISIWSGLFALMACLAAGNTLQAAEYHVNALTGNDAAAGGEFTPWKTISRVNNADLKPGDKVLFRKGSGQSWTSPYDILVPKSGIAGNPVIYGAHGGVDEALPVIGGINASARAYVKVMDLEISSGSRTAVLLVGANNITLERCNIHSTAMGWAPVVHIYSKSHHNRILNSKLSLILSGAAMNDILNLRNYADFNLIEGNTFEIQGGHNAINLEGAEAGANGPDINGTAQFNIIRKNTIISKGGSAFATMSNSNFNLIEENEISGCGPVSTARTEGGLTIDSKNNIVRKNILRDKGCVDSRGLMMESNSGSSGYDNSVRYNHVYNNVITRVITGGQGIYLGNNGAGGVSTDNNYFKNNAVYDNGGVPIQPDKDTGLGEWTKNAQLLIPTYGSVTNNFFDHNLFFKSNDQQIMLVNNTLLNVAELEKNNPLFTGNLQVDPMLDSEFMPQAGSPVIDKGTFLTTVASASGSGNSIQLVDAGYFSYGFELIDGDLIQVGTQRTRIQTINYSTNVITVSPAISWVQGANVSLPFNGSAPDIGVFESGSIAPVTFSITASAGANGSISPAGVSTVASGASRSYTITPASGYVIASVLVDGASVGVPSSYTFSNIVANHSISATFKLAGIIDPPAQSKIDASASVGGTITPSGSILVNSGGSQVFSIQPNQGYYTASVVVDGTVHASNLGATSYTFSNVTAPHSIVANFGVSTFTITASAGAGGSISPAGASTVNYGSSRTYTITPAAGYAVASVVVNGVSVGALTSYTFSNIARNHTISATFKVSSQISIQASASAGGTIAPSGTSLVNPGASLTYAITPALGYYTASVVVDGTVRTSNLGATSYTFSNVTAPHTIRANFGVSTFTITASAGAGGSISPAGASTVNYGSSKTYTITPAAGYVVASVLVNGASVGARTSYTFSNIAANQTITATFKTAQLSIVASAGVGGTISPSGTSLVNPGGSLTYAIRPAVGYYTASVVVDGAVRLSNLGATSYTFSNVTAPHKIVANFGVSTFTITASAGAGGSISPVGATTVNYGSSRTYTITPATGYAVASVLVNGVSVGARTSYTFSNIAANQTIAVTFQRKSWNIWSAIAR